MRPRLNADPIPGACGGGGGLVRPVAGKVQALQEQPRPRTKRDVQQFLGLTGYYHSFIPRYATLAAPLMDLT